MIDRATTHDLEVLRVLAVGRIGRGKGVGHADAVQRLRRYPIDQLRRLDPQDVVDRRGHVVDVVELGMRFLVRLDRLRPRHGQRIARAAEVRCEQAGAQKGEAAGPCPAGMIMVVGLVSAEDVESAQLVQHDGGDP